MLESTEILNLQQLKQGNYLVSEPNYHKKFFSGNLLTVEMRKTQILMHE